MGAKGKVEATQAEPAPARVQSKRLSIQARTEWLTWIERLADFRRATTSGVVDAALAEYAALHGFPEPPPRRV